MREFVETLALTGRAARAGITDLELGYSARNAEEWDQLMSGLEILRLIPTTSRHIERARQVQRQLAAASQRGRKIPDLLVAAAAEQEGYVLVHYDTDFEHISTVTGQPCQWVVPAGTID